MRVCVCVCGGGVEAYLRAFVYMCVCFPLRLLRLVFREKG